MFFLNSPGLESNYRQIPLWQSMRLDSDTQPSAHNTQSHKLVLWWRRSAELMKTTRFIIRLIACCCTLNRLQLVLLAPLWLVINMTDQFLFCLLQMTNRKIFIPSIQRLAFSGQSGMKKHYISKYSVNY